MKKNLIFPIMCIIIFFVFIGIYFVLLNSDKNNSRNIKDVYLKNSHPIDYSITKEFELVPFKQTKDLYINGNTLLIGEKSFSGNIIKIIKGKIIQESGKYYVETESAKSSTGAVEPKVQKDEVIINKDLSYLILLGEKYIHNNSNINENTLYDITLFETTKNQKYLLNYKDLEESNERDIKFKEYKSKVDEIKEKYWANPKLTNELIDELNKAYNIQINKIY